MQTAEEQLLQVTKERDDYFNENEILKKRVEGLEISNRQINMKVYEEKAKAETWRDCVEIITEKFADKL